MWKIFLLRTEMETHSICCLLSLQCNLKKKREKKTGEKDDLKRCHNYSETIVKFLSCSSFVLTEITPFSFWPIFVPRGCASVDQHFWSEPIFRAWAELIVFVLSANQICQILPKNRESRTSSSTSELSFASVSKRVFLRNHSNELSSAYRLIFMQIKLIFIWKILHEDSFWNRARNWLIDLLAGLP